MSIHSRWWQPVDLYYRHHYCPSPWMLWITSMVYIQSNVIKLTENDQIMELILSIHSRWWFGARWFSEVLKLKMEKAITWSCSCFQGFGSRLNLQLLSIRWLNTELNPCIQAWQLKKRSLFSAGRYLHWSASGISPESPLVISSP